jgi:hypothetical protein
MNTLADAAWQVSAIVVSVAQRRAASLPWVCELALRVGAVTVCGGGKSHLTQPRRSSWEPDHRGLGNQSPTLASYSTWRATQTPGNPGRIGWIWKLFSGRSTSTEAAAAAASSGRADSRMGPSEHESAQSMCLPSPTPPSLSPVHTPWHLSTSTNPSHTHSREAVGPHAASGAFHSRPSPA